MYALPYDLYQQRGLRRYGAHGTSVQYLVQKASQMLQKPQEETNLIVAHIGALFFAVQNFAVQCPLTSLPITFLRGSAVQSVDSVKALSLSSNIRGKQPTVIVPEALQET